MLLEICKYHVKLIYSAIYSARVYVAMLQADDIALHQRGYLGDKRDRTGGKGGW